MNEEIYFRFVEWTSEEPWRYLPYIPQEHDVQMWSKICNDASDPFFAKRYTTEQLFEEFKKIYNED